MVATGGKTAGRRDASEPERQKLWVKSGGRCAICGAYLLEGALTHFELFLGEGAHIVGAKNSEKSPRGIGELPEKDRGRADNLLLICADHHDEIDRELAAGVLTVERLLEIKRRHEEWIFRVTGLERNRSTVVLRMIGDVRGDPVEVSRPTASAAILASDERFPEFPLSFDYAGIEIDLRHLAAENAPDSPEYWRSAMATIDQVVVHKIKEGVRADAIRHLSVFAFARLPLLAYLGSKLDDTYEVSIYQRHRHPTETWEWPADEHAAVEFKIDRPDVVDGAEAVLILNVAGTINRGEMPTALAGLPVIEISAEGVPGVDTVRTKADLAAFVQAVRRALSGLEQSGKSIRRLHVLAALPVSAAVALGRARDPHVHPELMMYERTAAGAYSEALVLS